jgi:uncharacterized membrane protein
MKLSLRLGLVAAVGLMGVALAGTPAMADFQVCNKTKESVSVSVGYRESGDWISEGWWNIDTGDCATVYAKKLSEVKYYIYGESENLIWDGDYTFCVVDDEYTIVGDSDCKKRGYQPQGFMEVDVGDNTSFTFDLLDSGE